MSDTASELFLSEQTATAVSTSASIASRSHFLTSNLPIGWMSNRTQIPLIQSFLQPLSWLNPTENYLFRSDWGMRLSLSEPKIHFRFGPPVPPLLNILQPANQERPSRRSSGVLKLVESLSRWSQSIRQQIKAMSPTIVVVPFRQSTAPATESRDDNQTIQTKPSRQCNELSRRPGVPQHSSRRTLFQIRVKGQVVAELPTQAQADAIAQRLRRAFQKPGFQPSQLNLTTVNGLPGGKARDDLLFTVDESLEKALHSKATLIAIDWINNLRTALSAKVLTLAEGQAQMYGLAQTGKILKGTASWYGPSFHGRRTAAGETFDQTDLTAAHPSLPFDTYLKVTNLRNGNSVIVRINDRGPYVGRRSLDLSHEAARCLGSETIGVVPYKAVIMQPAPVVATVPSPARSPSGEQQLAQKP